MTIVSPLLQETDTPAKFPSSLSLPLVLGVVSLALCCAIFAGCGYTGSALGPSVALSGSVHGGRQAVSGASIQLYAVGSKGKGSAAQSLLSTPSKTDSSGNFTIPAGYGCPAATSQIYIVARGGNPGMATSSGNTALVLTAMLGSCSSLASGGPIAINEVTTIGSVWPIAQFMKSATNVGASPADPAFAAAVASIPEFINVAAGSSPGTPTATSYFAENAKLYSLADLLADCVNSNGGSAGDGSACGRLFTMATPASGNAPADTLTAAMNIAQNPNNNVSGIFGLVSADTPFQPLLSSAPADWTLSLAYLVATPAMSLASGTYAGTQQVTISDSTPGTAIYYTTDGTVPTTASTAYEGPISISVSVTLQAAAFLKGSASAVAASSYTISAPAPPARLAFLQQPTNAIASTNLSPAIEVVIEDGNGNTITGAVAPVTLALSGGSGLDGTLTVTTQNGVATFSNLSVSAAGSYTLAAVSPGLTTAISNNFIISAPPVGDSGPAATQLLFIQQPSNALTYAAIAPAVQVAVEDGSGNRVTNASNAVTLVLVSSAGIGSTLWTAIPQNGIATFNDLTVSAAGSGYTLSASSPGLSAVVSTPFTITVPSGQTAPAGTQLSFLQQPSNALTGATLSPAVQVVVKDSNGNAVTTATNPVTLTLGGGFGLGGTLTVAAQNGVATFGNLSISNAGSGYTLSASSAGLTSAVSTGFTISAPSSGNPPAPVKLAFSQQPSNAFTGTTIAPAIKVTVEDANGNAVLSAANPITLTLSANGGLAGTLTATAQNGVATFGNLSVSTAGTGYTLTASSPTLASATSSGFTISAPGNSPTPAKLIFLQQPANAVTGATLATVTVAIEDSNGATVSTASNSVTLALSGSGLSGTLSVAAQNGVASFRALSVSAAGTYTLSATSPGLAAAVSSSFTITAPVVTPPAVKLAFVQEPGNALTGATLSPAIKVMVEDGSGNLVASATNPVTLALSAGNGLGGTLTVTPQNGVATFANIAESNAGSYTLLATSPGLATAFSTGFTVSAPVVTPTAVKLAFAQQPSNALTGAIIAPAVTVVVEDASGNTVSNATNPVTLTLNGGGLEGTLTATPQNGIATFSSLSESTAGNYTLSAASPGLTSATSAGFTITLPLPTATRLVFLQQPANALTGATLTPAVTVLVVDSSGNTVTGAANSVTLGLVSGSGLSGILTVTAQNGVATFSNLSETTAGNYNLSATSPGLSSATSTGFTITAPVVIPIATKLAFSQQPSNALTGASIAPAVTVVVQDSSGNTVTGSTNPVTIALTSGSGLAGTLTIVPQNGVATFSNLSESVAGTYTLSATSPGLSSASSSSFIVSVTASCSITSFGAVGDGVTNNASAIQNTFNYAATHNCTAFIPAGTFAYSGVLTASGIAVTGTGAGSSLKALDTNNEALSLTGNGGSISNLVLLGTGTTRNAPFQAAMVWVNGATNFTVQNVLVNGGSGVGIFDSGGQAGLIENNTVENTLADSITNTDGAHNITVKGNHVLNSGDDGVSNNSYLNNSNTVHDIMVQGNTIIHNRGGRGLEVSGGSNITFQGNYVDNLDGATDMYIASESEYNTQNVSNIDVTGNTFMDGGPNQGSAIIYNSEAGTAMITGVTLSGNQFVNPKANAVQFTGNGSETGILITDNTDFSTNSFSSSSNPTVNPTMTGNQVLAPSTYTAPLVPPGGGCSFSGC